MGVIGSIKNYPFDRPNERNGYSLFPDDIENDQLVFFHGTAAAYLESMVNEGFKSQGSLPSVSFARSSGLALGYACKARSAASPDGCVVAVRFESIDKPGIKSEAFGIHVYKFDPQPKMIGYCIVPAGYMFV